MTLQLCEQSVCVVWGGSLASLNAHLGQFQWVVACGRRWHRNATALLSTSSTSVIYAAFWPLA